MPPTAGRREWFALAVLTLPLLLVSMDVSVLYFAVPFISRDLGATETQQLWIFDVYGFVLAGLLITMGAVGDRIGRRKLLMLGATAFGAASLAAAYAGSPAQLIVARAVLGIGGATLMPSTLALIRTVFTDEKQRAKAVAVWSAVLVSGVAVGPVLSGILLEHFWWGSVFLINLPAMALLLVLAPTLLPEYRTPEPGGFDLFSSVLCLAGVLPVVYGIKKAATDGLDGLAAAALAGGLAAGWAFVRRQRSATHPMIDLALFRSRRFSGALICNAAAMFALVGNAVFTTQYLQLVLDLSPLRAALWSLLPAAAVASTAAPVAAALGQRVPPGRVIAGAFLVAASGFVVLGAVVEQRSLGTALCGAALLAFGLVAVAALVAELVVGAVRPEQAGRAAAVMETTSEFGGALGIAVLGSIGAAVYGARISSLLPPGLRGAGRARESLPGALDYAAGLPASRATSVVRSAQDAFVTGMSVVSWAAAAVLALAAVIGVRLLTQSRIIPAVAVARADENA